MRGVHMVPSVTETELRQLDAALTDAGRMRLLPAATLRAFNHGTLRVWMQARGRYQLPTLELVGWLRERIAGRSAVEVGAGLGDVGRHVGNVTLTDSYFQTSAATRALYAAMGSAPITPPRDVLRYEALAAVRKFKPAVALACWVTQKYQPGDEMTSTGSCVGGVDEQELLKHVGEYIFVGNAGTHGDKRILELVNEEHAPDWIVSRAADQSKNRIWVWKS